MSDSTRVHRAVQY